MRQVALLAGLLLAMSGCAVSSDGEAAADRNDYEPMTWGSMREALRDGQTQGRAALTEVLQPQSVAVGAMAGLAGEVTVIGGRAFVAEVSDGLRGRRVADGDAATLLVLSNVEEWSEHELPTVSSVAELEASVLELASSSGVGVRRPFPFRVEGLAEDVRLHVLNGSCPIANPDGPPPWRFSTRDESVELVGFYAEGHAGRLTHHGQKSHVHAVVRGGEVSGHLDAVRLAPGARLFLPRR